LNVIATDTYWTLTERMSRNQQRYGPFSSSHEALGVCVEEWDELRAAVHANDLEQTRHECLDLAAALIRWHDQLTPGSEMAKRSKP
jgi:hypothetical protein